MAVRQDPSRPLPPAPDPWAGSEMPSRRDGPPWHMTEMIEAEPVLASRLLGRLADPASPAAALAAAIRAAAERARPILTTGCGTSEHGARAVAEILRDAMRTAGLPWRPGEGGAPVAVQALEGALDDVAGSGGLVIGVSHEGGTWATNLALERAGAAGATVSLITVSDRSPGAALADIVLTTGEQDQSWCHTVGYLSPILAAAAVAGHLTGDPIDPGLAAELLGAGLAADVVSSAEALAAALAGLDRIIVVGSGADRVPAHELVLKIEEGTHLPAAMRDLETLLHGHLAGMDERTGVVMVLTDERRADERLARTLSALAACRAIRCPVGAVLGADYQARVADELTGAGRIVVTAVSEVPPVLASLLVSTVPIQLLTERLARVLGVNPDPIRRDDPRYLTAAELAG